MKNGLCDIRFFVFYGRNEKLNPLADRGGSSQWNREFYDVYDLSYLVWKKISVA